MAPKFQKGPDLKRFMVRRKFCFASSILSPVLRSFIRGFVDTL